MSVDDPYWPTAIARAGSGFDFYHLPAYVSLCASMLTDAEPAALLIEEKNSLMVLPLILRPVSRASADGYRDAMSPYGYPGPIIALSTGQSHEAQEDFLVRAVAKMTDFFYERRIISVFVRFHPLFPISLGPFRATGELIHHGETVSFDLGQDEKALWQGMRSNHRTGIRRSEAAGHEVIFDSRLDYLDIFIAAYHQTMDRVKASHEYYFPRGYYSKLRDLLKNHMHLVLVRIDGRIASAALFTEVNGIIQYHLGGTFDEFLPLHSHKLLFHRVALWGKGAGHRWLHLGGGVGCANDSLYHFKAGFSPSRHAFHTWRLICDLETYRNISGVGEQGTNFFPAYRRAARTDASS